MGKSNIIEINGKRYDAHTGELLGGPSVVVQPPKPVTDVVRPAQTPAKPAAVKVAAPIKPALKTSPQVKVRVHDAVKAHPQTRRQQHSKTLMRSAVARPGDSLKRHAKAQSHIDALVDKPAARLERKASVRWVDNKRLRHASKISKSQAVSRFSRPHGPSPNPPAHLPARQPKTAEFPASHLPSRPQQSIPQSPTADILERALQAATSHEQALFTPPKRRRTPNRLASLTTIAVALLIVAGFVGFQNVNNVKLHLASSKAGFAASLPDYRPSGYHLSHLNAAPGTVAMNFQGNDNRSFAITEKASGWDSDALRDSFLASSGQPYRTIESGGRTLYVYGQNAATWVSGGVWYQVESNGSLNSQQLVQLATSM